MNAKNVNLIIARPLGANVLMIDTSLEALAERLVGDTHHLP